MIPRLMLLTFALVLAFQPQGAAAELPRWLRWLDRVLPVETSSPAALHAQKRVRLEEFSGDMGATAQAALKKELMASREFLLTGPEEQAEFTISGTSVGGRVVGRLKDKLGKQVFERTYAAPGLDANIEAFSDDIIFAVTGRPGLATSSIVFVSDRTGSNQVYVCDARGEEVQQVTHSPHGAVSPSLSPDGSTLAFTSYRSGFPIVRIIDLGSGWERTITDTPGTSFGAAFSPDGMRLALIMSFLGNPEVFVTDLGTNTAGCISDTVGVPAAPSWHPDGRQVIFSDDRGSGSRLYIAEVPEPDKQGARLFRWRTGYHHCTDPEWSPDGKAVAFTAMLSGDSAVVIKGYPEGRARVIQDKGARHPSWSPDGRYLCYEKRGALCVHDLATGSRKILHSGFGRISEPRWMK